MSDIVLSKGIRGNLLSLMSTADLRDRTETAGFEQETQGCTGNRSGAPPSRYRCYPPTPIRGEGGRGEQGRDRWRVSWRGVPRW